MSTTLAELTIAYADHLAEVADLEPDEDGVMGDDYEELLAALDVPAQQWNAKVDAYLSVADRLDADAESLAKQATRMVAEAKRLREAVRASMVRTGVKKHEGVRPATLCAGKPHVEVVALELVPADLRRAPAPPPRPETWPADKVAALPRLKAGEVIPGLTLAVGEPYLKVSK